MHIRIYIYIYIVTTELWIIFLKSIYKLSVHIETHPREQLLKKIFYY